MDLLLTVAALLYFTAAVAFLFAGAEILSAAGAAGTPVELGLLQLLGAALFGLAMLDWTHRHSLVGGIYARPVVVANLAHALSGCLILVQLGRDLGFGAVLVAALVAYGAVAAGFAMKLRGPSTSAGDRAC